MTMRLGNNADGVTDFDPGKWNPGDGVALKRRSAPQKRIYYEKTRNTGEGIRKPVITNPQQTRPLAPQGRQT